MERYFLPVRGPSEGEVKIQKHYHPIAHQHPHKDHYHHNQYHHQGSNSSSSSHGNSHDHHHHGNKHHHHRQPKVAVDPHGFTKRSSSSLSSSSSPSSSASWTSEPSLDDETYLTYNKPQHSLSCSNIPEVQQNIRDRESEDFDFDHRRPLHFQNPKQRHSLEYSGQLLPISQHGRSTPKLCRGHSRSVERLQQNKSRDYYSGEHSPMDHGPLYKTASLGQSLNVESTLKGRGVPKKAASSIHLPSKGILKNKDEGQKGGNFRKARSLEVLSTRVEVTGTSKQSSMEVARESFVKGKLQFSAFLDEITKQVISPSTLNSLGVTTQTPQKSPNIERKQYGARQKQDSVMPPPKQQPIRAERPDSGKTVSDSSSHSRLKKSQMGKNHARNLSSPPPPPPRHPPKAERHGTASDKQHHWQYSQLLTDGTSTSPEPCQSHLSKHKGRHQGSHGPSSYLHSKQEYKGSPPPLRAPGLDSESPSSKSSTSSEKSDKPKHMGHRRHSKPHRVSSSKEQKMLKDSVSAVDKVQLLEQYNKELHENLLQTVACIENMEGELQCTKAELANFKEKYRRLQESYSVSQQAVSVLEQKLKSTVDSLHEERKFLLQKVVVLTKQLDTAQKTVVSLENINVPSLIRELLKKHVDSQEELEHFLYPQTSPGQSDSDQSRTQEFRENPSSVAKGEERVFEWSQAGQKCSDASQQLVTAFLPWKHDHDPWSGPELLRVKGSDSQLPSSVADGALILKTIADAKAPIHQVYQLAMNTDTNIVAMPTHSCSDITPNPYILDMGLKTQTGGESRRECTATLGKDPSDATYLTTQRMLDNLLSQIPPLPTYDGEGKQTGTGARELAGGH
ncbi:uncharacterized protein LOC127418407 isoform X2 [Myxocyprinus asiaticus]|uniref:uncharacterized protein LOC127418407 isoform X2 n=1 Tax=Myxocyprinus asiaticus TaxID=70543 RepID=UPI002222F4FC|nr:uncharacterized protein LOC127418407 isoform X2 [Myxocyprinus asiaticus]